MRLFFLYPLFMDEIQFKLCKIISSTPLIEKKKYVIKCDLSCLHMTVSASTQVKPRLTIL